MRRRPRQHLPEVALLDVLHETPHLQLFALISVATAARMSAVLELQWSAVSIGVGDDVWTRWSGTRHRVAARARPGFAFKNRVDVDPHRPR